MHIGTVRLYIQSKLKLCGSHRSANTFLRNFLLPVKSGFPIKYLGKLFLDKIFLFQN